jgi:hypothetical protein
MEATRYDILRRENPKAAIWLESSADLNTAKSRIKQIVSFWPGRYEVIEHASQRVVAEVARPRVGCSPRTHAGIRTQILLVGL